MKKAFTRHGLKAMVQAGASALLALGAMGVLSAHAVEVKVQPDMAEIVTVSGRPSTVVVGNPLYADVVVVGNKILVQGRNYGKTNVIVLDVDGNRLARFDVVVSNRPEEEIELFKQGVRTTHLCAPECGQVINSNDDKKMVEDLGSRIQMRETIIKEATSK